MPYIAVAQPNDIYERDNVDVRPVNDKPPPLESRVVWNCAYAYPDETGVHTLYVYVDVETGEVVGGGESTPS